MLTVAKFSNITNKATCNKAFVKDIRIIRACDIDFNLLGIAIDFFFDKANQRFKAPLPLKLNKTWSDVQAGDLKQRVSELRNDTQIRDIEYRALGFINRFSPLEVKKMLSVQEMIVAVRFTDNRILIDGLHYDFNRNVITSTKIKGFKIHDFTAQSRILGEEFVNLEQFDIRGSQANNGFLTTAEWTSFNTRINFNWVYNHTPNAVFGYENAAGLYKFDPL